jgi:glutaredoxin
MIEIYGKPSCPFCEKAKALCEMNKLKYEYKTIEVDYTHKEFFEQFPTARTFPQIKINEESIGGYDAFEKYLKG